MNQKIHIKLFSKIHQKKKKKNILFQENEKNIQHDWIARQESFEAID